MPATLEGKTVYISTGDPETYQVSSLYEPGDLGKKFVTPGGKRYQVVQLSASSNAAAVNGIVFWADKSKYVVTSRVGDAANVRGVNGVAGRSPIAVTAGNYFAMQIGGIATVKFGGSVAAAAGDTIIAKASSTASDTDKVSAGTAPTNIPIGIARTASGSGVVSIDMMNQSEAF